MARDARARDSHESKETIMRTLIAALGISAFIIGGTAAHAVTIAPALTPSEHATVKQRVPEAVMLHRLTDCQVRVRASPEVRTEPRVPMRDAPHGTSSPISLDSCPRGPAHAEQASAAFAQSPRETSPEASSYRERAIYLTTSSLANCAYARSGNRRLPYRTVTQRSKLTGRRRERPRPQAHRSREPAR